MSDPAPQTRRDLQDLLARHDIRAVKRFGQNFLVDPNIVRKIVRLLDVPADVPVLEIGTGTGTLTAALVAAGHEVRSYEVDRRLSPLLDEVLAGTGVDLRFEDATEVDFSNLEGRWALAANLPYNVGTGLVLDILQTAPAVTDLVVMVQREVADRFVAGPGSKAYGIPSVIASLYADVSFGFSVPSQVFVPRPHVDSAVVVFRRLPAVPDSAPGAAALATQAFQQRRKMLRRSLAATVPDPGALLAAAGIAPERRADDLAPAEYLALAAAASGG